MITQDVRKFFYRVYHERWHAVWGS